MARVSELWLLDATINREVLERLAYGVRERGRVILDLWSAEFLSFIRSIEFKTPGGVVRESKQRRRRPPVRTPGLSGRWRRQFRMAIVHARANDFGGRIDWLRPVIRMHGV